MELNNTMAKVKPPKPKKPPRISSMETLPPEKITGRPPKFKEEYCQQLIDHMKKGFGINTFGAIIHVARETIYDWVNTQPTFSNAYSQGKNYYELFWETVGTKGTLGQIKGFNPTAWTFIMKNRFKWADRIDTVATHEVKVVPLSTKEVKEILFNDPFLLEDKKDE